MAAIPAVVENHLDAIHCTTDNKIILGSSNLTGRYWNGSLWCFASADDAPNVEKCLTGIDVSSGICDLAYLNNSVALGLDSGGLEIYKLDLEPAKFTWIFGVCEHDDSISSLCLNSDKTSLVTAGADKCIKIWDTTSWATTATYRPVHGGVIWQVTSSTEDPNIFVTCGQDGKILLFDMRLPKPATLIDSAPLKGDPTAVCWKPGSDSSFAVGDECGLVAIKDTRKAGSLSSWDTHKRRIFRLAFSKSKPWLASCSDDTDVYVRNLEGENHSIIYKNDDHEDFVRGLSWTEENSLISCGWDKRVLKHSFEAIPAS